MKLIFYSHSPLLLGLFKLLTDSLYEPSVALKESRDLIEAIAREEKPLLIIDSASLSDCVCEYLNEANNDCSLLVLYREEDIEELSRKIFRERKIISFIKIPLPFFDLRSYIEDYIRANK